MNGLPITACWFALVAGITGAIFATPDPGEMEFRTTLRVTAFTSSVPFLLAFTATALQRLVPSDFSRWTMRNRRYLGLSVAASHLIHTIAIIGLIEVSAGDHPIGTVTRVAGSLGIVLLMLMAATSNDLAVQTLGAGWRALHVTGLWVVWVDFIFTYSGHALESPLHAAMTALFVGGALARVWVWHARRTV